MWKTIPEKPPKHFNTWPFNPWTWVLILATDSKCTCHSKASIPYTHNAETTCVKTRNGFKCSDPFHIETMVTVRVQNASKACVKEIAPCSDWFCIQMVSARGIPNYDVTPRERQGPGKVIPESYWYIPCFTKQKLIDAAKQNIEK